MKGWEKTGWDVKPRFQNIYGKKGSKAVVWIDNWSKGRWGVVHGIEHPSKQGSAKYEEKGTYVNVSSKSEAIKYLKEYMRTH